MYPALALLARAWHRPCTPVMWAELLLYWGSLPVCISYPLMLISGQHSVPKDPSWELSDQLKSLVLKTHSYLSPPTLSYSHFMVKLLQEAVQPHLFHFLTSYYSWPLLNHSLSTHSKLGTMLKAWFNTSIKDRNITVQSVSWWSPLSYIHILVLKPMKVM